jgi:hypothetical protein
VGFRSATIRAAERWRSVKVTDFERRQMAAARNESMMAGLMKARHGPPGVGTMSWASRAALGAGGRMTPMGQFISEMRDLAEPKREGLRDGANGGSADSEEGEKRGADHVARAVRASSEPPRIV